jgi:hypothetical protein
MSSPPHGEAPLHGEALSPAPDANRSEPQSPPRAVPPSVATRAGGALRVVSVSLGSSSRDHVVDTELLGRAFRIERRGVDGDFERARRLIAELDGTVDAIGLGGIDLYLVAGGRRYIMRDGLKLALAARKTPVVDGSGLKDTLEREAITHLQREGVVEFPGQKALVTCAVDRFGVSEELVRAGADVTFGDFLFILGLPLPLRSLRAVRTLGALVLPIACRLPFQWLYPTGDAQTKIRRSLKHERFFDQASIVAGDFHLIRRFLPPRVAGKIFITNTVTASDVELLRERGARLLITSTPEMEGRSFATNVLEGVFTALGAKTPAQYRALLSQLNWEPRIERLQNSD